MTQTPPYQVTDPATGEVTETFPFATDAEVAEALAAATEAFAAWKLRPVAERAAVVKRVAGLFTERAADLAALITTEMGKRPAQALGEAEFDMNVTTNMAGTLIRLLSRGPDALQSVSYHLTGKVALSQGWLQSIPFEQRGTFRLQ